MNNSIRFKWAIGWGIYCLLVAVWDIVRLQWKWAAAMLICVALNAVVAFKFRKQ